MRVFWVSLGIFLLVLAAAIFVVIPSEGEIRFFVREEIAAAKNTLNGLGRDALTLASTQAKLASKLSSRFNGQETFLPPSGERIGPPLRLEDFTKSELELSPKTDAVSLNLRVNLVLLIQAYIDKFFSRGATFVIFENFQESPSAPPPTPQYEINVNVLWRESALIGQNSPADRRRVVREMSGLLVRAVFEREGCVERLCVADLPPEGNDLMVLTSSLDALQYGASAGVCDKIQDRAQCRQAVSKALTELEGRIGGGTMTQFGLFLVQVSALKDLVSSNGSTDAIAEAVQGMHSRLISARSKSAFVRKITSSDEGLTKFLALNGLEDLKLTAQFLDTYRFFIQGRQAYQSGQPQQAVEFYERVRGVPPWFAPYHEAFVTFSKLTADPENLDLLRKTMASYQTMKGEIPSYLHQAFIGVTAADAVRRFSERLDADEKARFKKVALEALTRSITLAPTPHDGLGARAERAHAHFSFGNQKEAENDIQFVERQLETAPNSETYRMVYMSTAGYFAAKGDEGKTFDYLTRAVKSYSRNLCAVLTSDEYAHVRNMSSFDKWQTETKTQFPSVGC